MKYEQYLDEHMDKSRYGREDRECTCGFDSEKGWESYQTCKYCKNKEKEIRKAQKKAYKDHMDFKHGKPRSFLNKIPFWLLMIIFSLTMALVIKQQFFPN